MAWVIRGRFYVSHAYMNRIAWRISLTLLFERLCKIPGRGRPRLDAADTFPNGNHADNAQFPADGHREIAVHTGTGKTNKGCGSPPRQRAERRKVPFPFILATLPATPLSRRNDVAHYL
jgi:hypothetical protein